VVELEKMMEYRAETIEHMNSVADELDKRHHDTNIAKTVGSGTAVGAAGVAAVSIVLIPFTLGLSAVVAAGAAVAAVAGTATTIGAHFTEKVMENVDLARVQKIVDRDREQCEKTERMWKDFEDNCSNIIQTITLADPREEPDMTSFKTWVLVAVGKSQAKIPVIAEALYAVYKEVTGFTEKSRADETINEEPMGKILSIALINKAKDMVGTTFIFKSVVSIIAKNIFLVAAGAAFLLIATIGVANIVVLIITSIDVHKGSLSKAAKDIREKSFKLEEEYTSWKNAFSD
jgi:hypothetical protein